MKYWKYPVLVVLLMTSGCTSKKEGNVIARFDGTTLTDTDFTKRVTGLPKDFQTIVLRKRADFVQEMVNEHFLEKEARKRNLENDPEVKDILESAQRKILVSKLVEVEVDKKVSLGSDEALKYYEANKEKFMSPLLLRVSHILVRTEKEAWEIKNQLASGADFEELARKRSMDNTASRGGDVGFFQKGQLIPEFEEVAFKLKKGQVSDVLKTQFGYHVLKLTDRAEPALREFGSMRVLLERQIVNEKRSRLFKELVERLKGSAKVEIDEKAVEAISVKGAK